MTNIIDTAERIVAGAEIEVAIREVDFLIDIMTENFVKNKIRYEAHIQKLIKLKENLVKTMEGVNG
jgi:hypothetical protein